MTYHILWIRKIILLVSYIWDKYIIWPFVFSLLIELVQFIFTTFLFLIINGFSMVIFISLEV